MAVLRLVATGAALRSGARAVLVALGLWLAAAAASAACMPSVQMSPQLQLLELERDGRAQPRPCAARLAALAEQAQADPALRAQALQLQGWLLAGVSDTAGVDAVARQLEQANAAAAALLVRARLAEQSGDTARAETLIDQAQQRLPADASPLDRLRFGSAQSHIRNSASRLEEAIRLDHQALKLADALAEPWRQAEVRNDLAYSYYQAGQLEQARRLNDEALDRAQHAGDAVTLAHVYTVRGIVLDALGDKRAEQDALHSALEHARRAGAKYEEALYLANLADHYLKKGDYATALRHAKAALPLTRELKNLGGETVALANIGLAQIALHDVEAGKRHLLASIAIDERRGSITGAADSYAEMGQYLERAGDAKGAIAAWQQHRALSAQLLARERQQAILEMQEQFEREQRERELALLQRDGAIKTEQLRARELQQRLGGLVALCGALALGAILLGVLRLRQANRQLAHSNAQLQQQAAIDPLTGLANRRQLQEAMRRLGADAAFSGTVFLADLDHFKRINDQHGHAAGDAVLVEVAHRLRQMLREADLIVRWGGEEFVVIVHALNGDAVQALAQRMLEAIGTAPCHHEGRPIAVTVSIGYATFPIEPGLLQLSWERAIGLVDTAMYLAKAHGRNRAYGVRMLRAQDAGQLDAIGRALETAWMAGEVALTPHTGPQRGAALCPALAVAA